MSTTPEAANQDRKLTLSWRIGLIQWETDEAFERLLGLLDEHREIVDF